MEDLAPLPSPTAAVDEPSKRRVWPILLLFLLVGGGFAGYYYYQNVWPYEATDNAFIEADVVRVSPQIPGQVLKVLVEDNQVVKEGDLLIEIDSKPYEVKLAADQASAQLAEAKRKSAEATLDLTQVTTKATLDQAEADLKASRAMLEQAHAETGAAEAEAKRAGLDLKRADLLSETAIPVQKRDLAESGSKVASARFLEARKAVLTAEARIQASEGKVEAAQTGPQQIEVARTQVKQAAAGVAQANAAIAASQLQLSYTKICAPVSGRVARKTVRPGETVAAGQALMAVVPDALYVIANFKETQLTHMRVGMPVEIYADTYPDRLLKAHIDSFQSGTGARFSLLPPENATGNYVKVVQRVPVKIVFEALPGPELLLAPGMSVVPKVRVQ